MPNCTTAELIEDALTEVGAGPEPGDDLAQDDAVKALRYLKRMVDRFQGNSLLLETTRRWPFALVSGQATRTIGGAGSGANYIVSSRPIWISDAKITPVGDTIELDCPMYNSRQEYNDEPLKTLTDAWPRRLLYERTTDVIGTLTCWPVPNTAATLTLAIPVPLTDPVGLNTQLSFRPGGYYEAWMLNLAVRLLRPFERATEPVGLREDAREALGAVMRLNEQGPPLSRSDAALTGRSGFDIRSNQSRGVV